MQNKHPFWMKLDWRGARPLTLRELIMKSYFKTTPLLIMALERSFWWFFVFRDFEFLRWETVILKSTSDRPDDA